jgi:hypothetical protein
MLLNDDFRKSWLSTETEIHGGIEPERSSSDSEKSGNDDIALKKDGLH